MKKILPISLFFLSFFGSAFAIPNLQLYCPEEGVYYDYDTESWIIPFVDYDLWVIGAGLEIKDVKIAFAVPEDQNGSIFINGVELNESLLVTNPYDPNIYDGERSFFAEFGTPLMGDGGAVPGGGVFPSSYYQYYLGDFGLDSTVRNYAPGDDLGGTASGHIETLTISVRGYTEASIIAYDHVVLGKNRAKFVKTPYSHDGSSNAVPEPATMLLFGTGLAGLISARNRLKKR